MSELTPEARDFTDEVLNAPVPAEVAAIDLTVRDVLTIARWLEPTVASIVTAAVEAERARIVSAVEATKAALPKCVCYPAECANFIDLSSPCAYCQARAALTVLASAAPAPLSEHLAAAVLDALADDAQAKVERAALNPEATDV